MTAAARNADRHRRQRRRGGAAVHAGQHHDHRQPARPRDQRQRLLPGARRLGPDRPTRATASSRSTTTGFIVNNQGSQLMGYPADAHRHHHPRRRRRRCSCPPPASTPQVTTRIQIEMNLDSRAAVTLPSAGAPIDFTDPTTYNNATSLTVYDAKGQDVALTYYFQKTGTDTWNVYATANGTPLGAPPAATRRRSTTHHLPDQRQHADRAGRRRRARHPGDRPTRPAPRRCRSPASRSTSRAPRSTARSFGVTDLTQDGYTAGQLIGASDRRQRQLISARYSNGQTKAGRPARARHLPQPAGPAADGRQRLGADRRLGRPDRRQRRATATSACCSRARSRNRTST